MDNELYIKKKVDFQKEFIEHIDNEDDIDRAISLLEKLIDDQKIPYNSGKIRDIIHFIQQFSENHQRGKAFFIKMEKILTHIKDQIKLAFSNTRLFNLFINNKSMLLIFFKLELIVIDEDIFNILMNSNIYFKSYFYPEIRSFVCKVQQSKEPYLTKLNDLKKEMLAIDPDFFENFDEKRQNGENHHNICYLIRNDSKDDFIIHCNENKISLLSSVTPSIFETNCFLINQKK